MKKIIVNVIGWTAVLSDFVYPYIFTRAFRFVINVFTSKRASLRIKNSGINFHIMQPFFLHNGKYISIGDNFSSAPGLRLSAFDSALGETFIPSIEIGNGVSINHNCHIGAIGKIKIGNNVLMGSNVLITDHFHGESTYNSMKIPPTIRPLCYRGEVILENDIWIGENVSIMPGVTIGSNSIIGSNSVVTKSFPPFSVIGGVPAQLIKQVVH